MATPLAAESPATPKRISARVAPRPHDVRRAMLSASAGSNMSVKLALVRKEYLYMSIVEQQLRKRVLASLIGTALLSCCIFPAAADDGKPRYVSGTGRDQGDCLNRFRPCRTLSYAIAQAGKGDSIQVAEGTYTINQSAQLFDLLSV